MMIVHFSQVTRTLPGRRPASVTKILQRLEPWGFIFTVRMAGDFGRIGGRLVIVPVK